MNIADYLSKDEIRYFTSRDDGLAWRTVLKTWALLLAIFWMATSWTNPLTIMIAVILLAGQQLGLAVITHECGHRTLFKTQRLNDLVGQYLAANVVFSDMFKYAKGHTSHHKLAGTPDDPDLPNYKAYPINSESFKRKMKRDLTGQTGYKLLRFVFTSARGIFSADPETRRRARPFAEQIAVNAAFAVFLGVFFAPWAYLLWLAAFLTTYMMIVRIRQVAEHAAVPDLYDADPRLNTRTTIASWWEQLLFAPNGVNYHLEHHFMASVPCYRLREMHELLKSRGCYDETRIFQGYGEVLKHTVVPA